MNIKLHNYIIEVYRVVGSAYEYFYVKSFSLNNNGVSIETTPNVMDAFGCKRVQTAELIVQAINNSPCEYAALIMDAHSCAAADGAITEEQYNELVKNL